MDSLTQAVLGASVAGVCAPREHRRAALLAGAALGTLPDLDVLLDYGDPVRNFTYHRGFSHSLVILAPFSVLLWLTLRRWWAPARAAPLRWLAAIALALLTHPLLDAHTSYGTQVFWPLPQTPVMWSTIFIIDPLYTLPLLVGVAAAASRPARRVGSVLLGSGLVLSTAYLGWTWVAKGIVGAHARESLAAINLEHRRVFTVPTPLNSLLWRIVVMTDDGYLEGFDSLLVDDDRVAFRSYPSDVEALRAATEVAAVARLRWFADDFVRAEIVDDRLLISDLRMGQEPSYVFNFLAAARGNPHWKAIPVEQVPLAFSERALAETWHRLWSE